MKLFSLGSGSSGNAFVLQHDDSSILIDCGVGARVLRKTLTKLNLFGRLTGAIISHEHSDHIRSLKSLRRFDDCPVYATAGTLRSIGREPGWQEIHDQKSFTVGDVEITPVAVAHDAAEPVGFLIDATDKQIALFTDLGSLSEPVLSAVGESTLAVLEANYCEQMLRSSPYPAYLKRRIRGMSGHLSNDDCAAALAAASNGSLERVWLAHLSENNNTPERAYGVVAAAMAVRSAPIAVDTLPRHDFVELTAEASTVARQPGLPLGD